MRKLVLTILTAFEVLFSVSGLHAKPLTPVSGDTFKQGKALFDNKQYTEAFRLFKKAASEGDSNGYYYMGLCYQRGLGVGMDAYQAYYMCDKAADMKNPDALFWKAKAFLSQYLFTPKDYGLGISWLKEAADLGQADACEQYAQYLITGWTGFGRFGDGKDVENSMKYFDKAVEGGSVDAYCTLAQYYYFGVILPKDLAKSKYYADKLKAVHTARAYLQLAVMYGDGSIGIKSKEKEKELLRKASEMGDGDASYELSYCMPYRTEDPAAYERILKLAIQQGSFNGRGSLARYYNDIGEHSKRIGAMIDYGLIKSAYESLNTVGSADKVKFLKRIVNNPPVRFSFLGEANNWLGNLYYNGDGVQQSYVEAVKYYRTGAGYGNHWAEYNLADCYLNGYGVEKNNETVFYWLKKAADGGLAIAQKDLGYCYCKGIGTKVNYSESFRSFKKAAEADDAEAQFMLAYHYAKGWGTSLDKNQCLAWLEKSAANGYEPAKKNLPEVRAAIQRSQNSYGYPTSVDMAGIIGNALNAASSEMSYYNFISSASNAATSQINQMTQSMQESLAKMPPASVDYAIPDNSYSAPSSQSASASGDLCPGCAGDGKCRGYNTGMDGMKYFCAGTGNCYHCFGKGYYYNSLSGKEELCGICGHTGKCQKCGGTGICPLCHGTGRR